MTKFLFLLQKATLEYNSGNLISAKKHIKNLLHALEGNSINKDNPLAMFYLNALTMAQSIATRTHDLVLYEQCEPKVKEGYLCLFNDFGSSYYGLHLTDSCECYATSGDVTKARQLLIQGMTILEKENGTCPLLNLIYHYHTGKLHYQMNQFYQCIDAAITANSCWLESPLIPDNASPFLKQLMSKASLIAQIGCSNLVQLASAYGKINTPEYGITILTELLSEPINDYYFKASVEITLAELYTLAGEYDKSRELYFKYKSINISAYPDLCASLATLSIALDAPDSASDHTAFIPEFDEQLSNTFCYNKDTLQILFYNRGLKMIAQGQYSDALTLFKKIDYKSLSIQLYLLAKMGEYASIPKLKQQADFYFKLEIRNLFFYYNEKLVHNHLSLLESHFALCMDSYVTCLEHLGADVMPPAHIYDFLLETKYISLEASYLSRLYQTPEALNHRRAFASDDIRKCLPKGTALLEYCLIKTLGNCYYCVFLITTDTVSCIRLEEQSVIDNLISKWHNLMQTSIHASVFDPVVHEHDKKQTDSLLRRHLFRPLKEFLFEKSIHSLIIAPAGNLIHFPFSCLPISSNSYLGTKYKITYINTGKELITNPPVSAINATSALVLGNPDFIRFKPLPYAEQEAINVANALGTPCFIGKAASLSLFEVCLNEAPSLLHLATHGVFHEQNHDRDFEDYNCVYQVMEHSGLVLSGDELLSCNMIMGMNLSHTALTVLSSCQTGKGIFHPCEGVYGLRRAFRLAGCHSLILSLWQVDDRSGCLFMEYFYHYLLNENHNAKEAFFYAVSALKNYREQKKYPFAHPYYWAGYIFME